jgi:predicted ATPase
MSMLGIMVRDTAPIRTLLYEETEHHRTYRSFMEDRSPYLKPR